MDVVTIVCIVVGGVIGLALSFRLFFKNGSDFWDTIRLLFTPDIVSMFRGEGVEDQWATLKFFVWLLVSAAFAFGGYKVAEQFFS